MAHNTLKSYALAVYNLTVAYNNKPALWNLNVSIPEKTLLAVVGPNGAGKTTFIKSILGLIQPIAGHIHIFGKSYVHNYQYIAYIPQRSTVDWDFPITVFEVVLMGRYGHLGWMQKPRQEDKDRVWDALASVGLTPYAHMPIGQLSGGQQQRGFLARALVQDASIYLLDEPFIGVDIKTEQVIIALLKSLRDAGKTIIVVHHDLHTVREYFDTVLLLNRTCIAYGSVNTVLTPKYVCATYGEQRIFFSNLPKKDISS